MKAFEKEQLANQARLLIFPALALFYLFFQYLPDETLSLQATRDRLAQDEKALKKQAAEACLLNNSRRAFESARTDWNSLFGRLPGFSNRDAQVRDFERLALECGVTVRRMNLGRETPKIGFPTGTRLAYQDFTLALQGPYPSVRLFIQGVESAYPSLYCQSARLEPEPTTDRLRVELKFRELSRHE